jgi:glycerol uptake facilitator-like aquaporin
MYSYEVAAVIIGVLALAVQAVTIYIALQRTPLDPSVSLGESLRRSFVALGPARRRWAEHPWRMTLVYTAAWLLGSVALGARMAFYAR